MKLGNHMYHGCRVLLGDLKNRISFNGYIEPYYWFDDLVILPHLLLNFRFDWNSKWVLCDMRVEQPGISIYKYMNIYIYIYMWQIKWTIKCFVVHVWRWTLFLGVHKNPRKSSRKPIGPQLYGLPSSCNQLNLVPGTRLKQTILDARCQPPPTKKWMNSCWNKWKSWGWDHVELVYADGIVALFVSWDVPGSYGANELVKLWNPQEFTSPIEMEKSMEADSRFKTTKQSNKMWVIAFH